MTLVDVPLVSPGTIATLIRVWRETGAPIVRPARGETHGHPVLFDRRVFAELRAADPHAAPSRWCTPTPERRRTCPSTDEGAFLDLDTPEDYERALALIAD